MPLHEADMRALPAFGEFDLVTCLDDALNHLLTRDELLAALQGIRRNLAPGGVAVWDLNTLAAYRAETHMIAADDPFVVWESKAGPVAPGMRAEVVVHFFRERVRRLLAAQREPSPAAALARTQRSGRRQPPRS